MKSLTLERHDARPCIYCCGILKPGESLLVKLKDGRLSLACRRCVLARNMHEFAEAVIYPTTRCSP